MIDHLLRSYVGSPSSSPIRRLGESPLDHQAQQLQSDPLQVNHPKLREEDHNKESGVEEEQAEAVCLAEPEALKWDGDQREDEAEPQGAGQHPHQQSIWLQLWGEQERLFRTHRDSPLSHGHHAGRGIGSLAHSYGFCVWNSKAPFS